MIAMAKITDFLTRDISADDLAAALRVVRAFKRCESSEEWLALPFRAWAKLEQLEEFLAHRVEGAPLEPDTLAYMLESDKST